MAIHRQIGEALFWDRQYEAAIEQLQASVEMAADLFRADNLLALVYSSNNQPEKALRQRQKILRTTGRSQDAERIGAAFERGGEPEMLRWYLPASIRRAEQARQQGPGRNLAWGVSLLYARLDETEEAFRWLEEAVRQRGGLVFLSKVHPWFDSLRSDPRFGQILRKMNLE